MVRLLNWLGVLQFLSVPALIVLAIWNGELRFAFIAIVLMFSAGYTISIAQAVFNISNQNSTDESD